LSFICLITAPLGSRLFLQETEVTLSKNHGFRCNTTYTRQRIFTHRTLVILL